MVVEEERPGICSRAPGEKGLQRFLRTSERSGCSGFIFLSLFFCFLLFFKTVGDKMRRLYSIFEVFKYKRRKLNGGRGGETVAAPNNVALLNGSLCGKTCQDVFSEQVAAFRFY